MYVLREIVQKLIIFIWFLKGKGHAEMAVSRHRTIQSGITTPESIPSTPMSSSFDEESVSVKRIDKKLFSSFSFTLINHCLLTNSLVE